LTVVARTGTGSPPAQAIANGQKEIAELLRQHGGHE
jgi:hypothetical protein